MEEKKDEGRIERLLWGEKESKRDEREKEEERERTTEEKER